MTSRRQQLVTMVMLSVQVATLVDGRWNLLMNELETARILGVPGSLYYVRNGVLNDYALAFNLPLKSNVTELVFDWNATDIQPAVEYRMGLSVSNPMAMALPEVSIPPVGRVPIRTSSFTVKIPCTGLIAIDVDIKLMFNISFSRSNNTVLEIRRRKPCLIAAVSGDEDDVETPSVSTSGMRSISTIVYVSLGCLGVIAATFVALALTCRHRRQRLRRQHPSTFGCQKHSVDKKTATCRNNYAASSAVVSKDKGDVFVLSSDKLSNESCYNNPSVMTSVPQYINGIPSSSYYPISHHYFPPSCGRAMTPDVTSSSGGSSVLLTPDGGSSNAPDDLAMITRRRIAMKNLLIEGSHGVLCHAVVTSSESNEKQENNGRSLIIKTVTDLASNEDIEAMLQDAFLLRGMRHDNLKSVVTVCFEPHLKPLLVYRCDNECYLKVYLQMCKTAKTLLTPAQQVYVSAQITSGLQFLHHQHICHRDVATRNCLVGDNLRVRLSDSALSWTLFPGDYQPTPVSSSDELPGRQVRVPIRWTAVEQLANLATPHSSQTDMWSLGVTLWELATHGATPYSHIEHPDMVTTRIIAGYRLSQPSECPAELYAMMSMCWSDRPELRPSSLQLNNNLVQLCSLIGGHFV